MERWREEATGRGFWGLAARVSVLGVALGLLGAGAGQPVEPVRTAITIPVNLATSGEGPANADKAADVEEVASAKRVATQLYWEALLSLDLAPPQVKRYEPYDKSTILRRIAGLDPGALVAMPPVATRRELQPYVEAFAGLGQGWGERAERLAQRAGKYAADGEERDRMYENLARVLSSRQDFGGAEEAAGVMHDPRLRSLSLAAVAGDAKPVDASVALNLYKKAFAVAQQIPASDENRFVPFNWIAYGVMDLDPEMALDVSRVGPRDRLPYRLREIAGRIAPKDRERGIQLLEEAARVAAENAAAREAAGRAFAGDVVLPDDRIEIARAMAPLDKGKALAIALSISERRDRLSALAALARDTGQTDRQFAFKCVNQATGDPAWSDPSFHDREGVLAALAGLDPQRAIKLARERDGVSALPTVARALIASAPALAVSLADEFLADAAKRNRGHIDGLQLEVALVVVARHDLQRAISLAKSRSGDELVVDSLSTLARDLVRDKSEGARAVLQEGLMWAERVEDPVRRYHLLAVVGDAARQAGCRQIAIEALQQAMVIAAGTRVLNRDPVETEEECRGRAMYEGIVGLAAVDPWAALEWAERVTPPRPRARAMVVVADGLLTSVGIQPANAL